MRRLATGLAASNSNLRAKHRARNVLFPQCPLTQAPRPVKHQQRETPHEDNWY